MGREVRRVPGDWQYPRDNNGDHLALHDGAGLLIDIARWDEEASRWAEGFCTNYNNGWEPLAFCQGGRSCSPWHDRERSHYIVREHRSVQFFL